MANDMLLFIDRNDRAPNAVTSDTGMRGFL